MPNKNTIALLMTGLITVFFFVCGLMNILDYVIVKAILFLAFSALALYIVLVVAKTSKTDE